MSHRKHTVFWCGVDDGVLITLTPTVDVDVDLAVDVELDVDLDLPYLELDKGKHVCGVEADKHAHAEDPVAKLARGVTNTCLKWWEDSQGKRATFKRSGELAL